jgi:hypothetical protein
MHKRQRKIAAKGFLNKRKSGLYPPAMRKLLGEVGTELVTSLQVVRVPVQSTVSKLLQLLSAGTYQNAVASSNYDTMFHLAIVINGTYTLDKQQVVKFVRGAVSVTEGGDSVDVQVPPNTTIQQLIDNTKIRMGNAAFTNYNALNNNCQVFILNVLQANNVSSPALEGFIMQDAQSVFDKMPQFTKKAVNAVTDLGAWADKVVQGEGGSWKDFYRNETKGKKFKNRQEVNDHMRSCAQRYKQSKKT